MPGTENLPLLQRLLGVLGRHDVLSVPFDGSVDGLPAPERLPSPVVGRPASDSTPGTVPPLLVLDGDLARVRRSALVGLLGWLARLRRPVVVWMSLDPQGRGRTLMPPAVWRRLFAAAGCTVVAEVTSAGADASGTWDEAWRVADPFRLAGTGAAALCLAPDVARTPDHDALPSALLRRLVGPQVSRQRAPGRLGFLVSSYQDFHALAPWLDATDPRDATVLLRAGYGPGADRTVGDLRAACEMFDVPVREVEQHPAGPIRDAGLDLLVTASESTMNTTHLLNAAIVAAAGGLGVTTAHLQHGIWPRGEFPPPVHTVADLVLAWSDEYAEVIAPGAHELVVSGAPRFDRYADDVQRSSVGLYGDWAGQYRRHVLITTNLHWLEHALTIDVERLVTGLADAHPDTLFTLKPHPYEAPPRLAGGPANIVVLEERVMLAAGLDPADVIESADLVVSTPSTVTLEARLARKPVFVIDTRNPTQHDGVTARPVEELSAWLAGGEPDTCASRLHAERYCASSTRGRAVALCLDALKAARRRRRPENRGLSLLVAGLFAAHDRAAGENDQMRQYIESVAPVLSQMEEYIASLKWTLERKDKYITQLHDRIGQPAQGSPPPGASPTSRTPPSAPPAPPSAPRSRGTPGSRRPSR